MPASSQTSDETNTTNNNNTREPAATSSSSTSRRGHAIATLNIANLIAYIANAGFVSSVPVLLKLPDNAEVSNKYQTLVTPAGFAFAIWGVIFLVQAIWSIVQIVVPTVRRNPLVIRGVGYHYVLVCACQVAWTFAFSLEQLAMSLFWMLGILFYLLRIYMAQDKVLSSSSHDEDGGSYSKNYWLLRFPFGLHFGWIVAASLVNVNLVLVAYDVSPDVQYATAIATLTAAVLASGFVLFKETQKPSPNVVVPLVLVWALVRLLLSFV